jgi:hypothetical protein
MLKLVAVISAFASPVWGQEWTGVMLHENGVVFGNGVRDEIYIDQQIYETETIIICASGTVSVRPALFMMGGSEPIRPFDVTIGAIQTSDSGVVVSEDIIWGRQPVSADILISADFLVVGFIAAGGPATIVHETTGIDTLLRRHQEDCGL